MTREELVKAFEAADVAWEDADKAMEAAYEAWNAAYKALRDFDDEARIGLFKEAGK